MKLPFSETWIISLVSRPDRYEKMRKQIDWFDWDVYDHRVVLHPHCQKIMDGINFCGVGHLNTANAFSCTREHYTLIKSAYIRGLESICIMEDDVSFYLDQSIWQDYMSSLPSDWDILRICAHRGSTEENYFLNQYPNSKWAPVFLGMWGTGCYALNRRGMKYMIDQIDSFMQPIDQPLYSYKKDPRIKHYFPNIPLGLCLEDSFKSDINMISDINHYFEDIKSFDRSKYEFKD